MYTAVPEKKEHFARSVDAIDLEVRDFLPRPGALRLHACVYLPNRVYNLLCVVTDSQRAGLERGAHHSPVSVERMGLVPGLRCG